MSRIDISDSKSTLNEEVDSVAASAQTIEVTADSVLIKKEKLAENKHGSIFKGERVSMYSELGIQPVLINEINLNENPHCGMQFIHERMSAPALGFSKQSPHIAKCFGLYMNSKGTQIWLVTEYLPYSVHDLIESGPLEEQQIAFIIAEVIKGLDYLHSLGVCHGDIVSHQVMLTPQGEVKLAGFHLATDKLDTMQLTGTVDREDSGYKDDVLSVGKMAVELVQGPQISKEHAVTEKEIPSLLNQFSQNFRNLITSCLQKDPNQRPSAAQLINYPLVKKARRTTALKDYKLLFNRCKRFKRSLGRKKGRKESADTTRKLSKEAAPGYDEVNSASDLHSQAQSTQGSLVVLQSEYDTRQDASRASDLPIMTWEFGNVTVDPSLQMKAHQKWNRVKDPLTITFETATVSTEERICTTENNTTERIFKGTFMKGDQPSSLCLLREIDLTTLPKGALNNFCNRVVTPLLHSGSTNTVAVLHIGFSNSMTAELNRQSTKLYLVTEAFCDSIHELQTVGPIEEDLIAWILREVLKGLDYLHSQRIAYGNMTSHDILFSVDSGSFEIKLNHSHAVVDELDDRTASNGSETSFSRNVKADIWSLGIIATELAHGELPSIDLREDCVPLFPSTHSKSFTDFVASCLKISTKKRPTAHDLLESSFIKETAETCSLEDTFDLYWKHILMKEQQLLQQFNDDSELGFTEQNLDEDQLLPKTSWSFNESPVHIPQNQSQPEVAAIPQPPPLSSWNENEMKEAHKSQTLTNRHRQMTQESVYTQYTDKTAESRLSLHEEHAATPLLQHASNTSLLSGQAQQPASSGTEPEYQQDWRHPSSLPSFSSPLPPPNLQAGPWWMYPPWMLSPPWWLQPPSPYGNVNFPGQGFSPQPWWQRMPVPQQSPYGQYGNATPPRPQHMANGQYGNVTPQRPQQMANGQHGNVTSPRQGYDPRYRPTQAMSSGQQRHRRAQGIYQPWWLYPPTPPSWWQHSQQQHHPTSPDGYQARYRHSFPTSSQEDLVHQPKENFHQPEMHEAQQSLPVPKLQPTEIIDDRSLQQQSDLQVPLLDEQPPDHKDRQTNDLTLSSLTADTHPSQHQDLLTKQHVLPEFPVDEYPLKHADTNQNEFLSPLSMANEHPPHDEDLLIQHIPLLESIVDDHPIPEGNNLPDEVPHLQPNPQDLIHEDVLAQELPLLQSTIDNYPLLHTDEEMQPRDDNVYSLNEELFANREAPFIPQPKGLPDGITVHDKNHLEQCLPQMMDQECHVVAITKDQQTSVHDPLTKLEDHTTFEIQKAIVDDFREDVGLEMSSPLLKADDSLSRDQVMQTYASQAKNSDTVHPSHREDTQNQELLLVQETADELPSQGEVSLHQHSPQLTVENQVPHQHLVMSALQTSDVNHRVLPEDSVIKEPQLHKMVAPQLDSIASDKSPRPIDDTLTESEGRVDQQLLQTQDAHSLSPLPPLSDEDLADPSTAVLNCEDQTEQYPPPPKETNRDLHLQSEEPFEQDEPLTSADDVSLQSKDQLDQTTISRKADDHLSLQCEDQLIDLPLPTANTLPLQSENQLANVSLLSPDIHTSVEEDPPGEVIPPPPTMGNDLQSKHEEVSSEENLSSSDLIVPEHSVQMQYSSSVRSDDDEGHSEPPMTMELQLIQEGNSQQNEDPLLEKSQNRDQAEPSSPRPVQEVEYSLQDLVTLHPLEEHQIAAILLKVAQILDNFHSQGKVNNNAAIANITISESGEVKLVESNVGESVLKMIPEVEQLEDDYKADIWSLGVTAVEIANGEPPDASVMELLFNSIMTPQFLDDDDFSEEFEDFVSSCLKADPDERLSAEELLEHDFFKSATQDNSVVIRTLVSQYKDSRCTQSQQPADDLVANEDQLGQHLNHLTVVKHQIQHNEQMTIDCDLQATSEDNSPVLPEETLPEKPSTPDDDPAYHNEGLMDLSLHKNLEDLPLQEQSEDDELIHDVNLVKSADPVTVEQQLSPDVHTSVEEDPPSEVIKPPPMMGNDLQSKHKESSSEESQPVEDCYPIEAEKLVNQTMDSPQSAIEDTQEFVKEQNSSRSTEDVERKVNQYSLEELTRACSLEEHEIATIFLKVVQSLDNLHSQGKVNNGVTIANITISESGEVKLVESNVGESVLKMIPEVEQLEDDHKADIWSLGVTAVEIANGEPPDASVMELLFNSIMTPQFLDDDDFSEEFEDFISSCLKADPDERSSAEELLEHDFLTSASTDVHAVSSKLITRYKEWRMSELSGDVDEGV